MSIADASKFDAVIGRIGVRLSYPRKAMIYCEKDPAERVYKVLSGSVFTCKNLSDGRRQIVGLYLPGDFFGLGPSDEYSLSAEVVGNAKVLVVKKKALAELANRDAAIQSTISFLLAREVERMRDRVLLLCKNAQERVVEFLLHMQKRTPAKNLIELPLLRQDIADYLGLTIETVSRIITFFNRGPQLGGRHDEASFYTVARCSGILGQKAAHSQRGAIANRAADDNIRGPQDGYCSYLLLRRDTAIDR